MKQNRTWQINLARVRCGARRQSVIGLLLFGRVGCALGAVQWMQRVDDVERPTGYKAQHSLLTSRHSPTATSCFTSNKKILFFGTLTSTWSQSEDRRQTLPRIEWIESVYWLASNLDDQWSTSIATVLAVKCVCDCDLNFFVFSSKTFICKVSWVCISI